MHEAEPMHGLVRHQKATRIWNVGITRGAFGVDPAHEIISAPFTLGIAIYKLRITTIVQLRSGASG